MEKQDMTAPEQKIMVAVSGGADSVCLLFVLLEYAKRQRLKLAVVHVDHGLRREAGEDAEFVRHICEEKGLPFFLKKIQVGEYAADMKCSLEEAGRILRYKAFRQAAGDFGADRIAVAHNGDDMAETMLFNLFRGSGVRGLCGIPSKRGEIIRPLLCLERREIEEYLEGRGISYRTDHTNKEDLYTRNRIRHHILPAARQQVSEKAVLHMCRTADILREAEDYLETETKTAMEKCVRYAAEDGGFPAAEIDAESFSGLHIAIRRRLILSLLTGLSPGKKDISRVHVEDVLALFEKNGSREINLPFGIRAEKRYGMVRLERGEKSGEKQELYREFEIPSGGTGDLLELSLGEWGRAEISVYFNNGEQNFSANQCTNWLDCDKIKKPLVFRFRKSGDFLTIFDGSGSVIRKSVKDYMINEKIPKKERDMIPVLAQEDHVLLLAGRRMSDDYRVNENTKRIMKVKLIRNSRYGGMEEDDGGTHQGTFVGGKGRSEDPGDRTPDQ